VIALFTDFGLEGPYLGQVQAVLHTQAPGIPVVNLMADLPPFAVEPAAYLLPAFAEPFPDGTVFLAVVDPGVGTERPGVVVETERFRFVGPGNGLFDVVCRRAARARVWRLPEPAADVSASFHGRDVFAPVAARIASGRWSGGEPMPMDWRRLDALPDEHAAVAYVDRYGNAMTGVRAVALGPRATVVVMGRRLARARTFGEVAPGEAFWYANSNGLVEIAVREGSAARALGLRVGTPVRIDGREDE
jgi:S-adenosylmethionine hydrolase